MENDLTNNETSSNAGKAASPTGDVRDENAAESRRLYRQRAKIRHARKKRKQARQQAADARRQVGSHSCYCLGPIKATSFLTLAQLSAS